MISPLRIVLCRHVETGHDAEELAHETLLVKYAAYQIQSRLREYIPDTQVMGLLEISDKTPAAHKYGGDYNLPEMELAYAASDLKFDLPVDHWHMWGGTSTSFCGLAPKPGSVGQTMSNCGISTMLHELGHNFGLGHSARRELKADGYVTIEYGGSGLMASSTGRRPWYNGPNLVDKFGWVPKDITASREILLCPLMLPKHGQHPQEDSIVRIGDMHLFSYDGVRVWCTQLLRSSATVKYATLNNEGDIASLLDGYVTSPSSNSILVEHMGSVNDSVKVAVMIDGADVIPVQRPATLFPEVLA